jgi:23S rRNA (uridine2552-2'-O)-methyltransferase
VAKTRWFQERSREGYYRQAKREGYRARSAYKLQQIDDAHHILDEGDAVADLGCAPGGWSQILVERVGAGGLVVGVDLQRVKPITGLRFVQGDFTARATKEKVAAELVAAGRSSFNAVVSDMAPDMSGSYDTDQARSVHLAEAALAFAVAHLGPKGSFCCKVFEGADFQAFRAEVRRHFRNVQQLHPPASRSSSSEVYLVAKGFKGRPGPPPPAAPPASAPAPPPGPATA